MPVLYNPVYVHVNDGGAAAVSDSLISLVFDPISSVKPSSLNCNNNSINNIRRRRSGSVIMASNLRTNNYLRHVESMKHVPSGAGNISHLNAVILGESLATEEDDFVLPSKEFATQANVQSPEQVSDNSQFSFTFL